MTLASGANADGNGGPGQAATAPEAQALIAASAARGRMALLALLGATLLGTLSNNILNVPLRDITRSFRVPLSSGVLVVTSFVLVLAAALPITGWVGDRVGRRRTLVWALGLMAAAMIGAALTPSLPVLVGVRAVQGLACAAIPPSVMGLMSAAYRPDQRARAMGAWAAANGLGQAVGPPVGGFLSDLWGWRSIFWALAGAAAVTLVATVHGLPEDPGRAVPLHWLGTLCLTVGAALTLTAATLAPQRSIAPWVEALILFVGALLIVLFAVVSNRTAHPIVKPRLIVESRFVRSAVASFAQMFALATVLVAVPLYLTGELGRTTAAAGLIVFALPAAMTILAPAVGMLSDRAGPRLVLRVGLVVLAASAVCLGFFTDGGGHNLAELAALLVVVGAGVALVQTPAATGATRSPAGQIGSALGVFNMVRFGGSAFGTAWVAIVYPHGSLLLLFAGTAITLMIGAGVTLLGLDPRPERPHPSAPRQVTSA